MVMIKKIRILLEYNTYCLWLYDENDEIIDNDNPPEWNDDEELTKAFMAVSDLYDSFFVDNPKEFAYIGCPDEATAKKLKELFNKAVSILTKKNNGKYIIQNDVSLDNI
jgi:ABC-type glycerol-3-phosphate transport system substrate-binding protein